MVSYNYDNGTESSCNITEVHLNRLSSSRKFTSPTAAVCPNETVYLRCVSNSIHGLVWHLPSEVGLQSVSYLPGDPVHNIKRVGAILVWLEESQPVLDSYVMIPYPLELGETTLLCESGNVAKSYKPSCKIINHDCPIVIIMTICMTFIGSSRYSLST